MSLMTILEKLAQDPFAKINNLQLLQCISDRHDNQSIREQLINELAGEKSHYGVFACETHVIAINK